MLHAVAAAAAPAASADFLASGISPWSGVNDRIRFVERQRRALQVNTHLQMYRTRGINFDWLHPSVDTILRGAHFVDIEQLSEPMRSLVAYCRRLEFHLTNTQIASICQEIADAHIRCETRIACVTRTMIEEGMHDEFIFVLERLIRRSMANVGWHLSGRVPVLRECNARPFDLSMPVDVEPSEEAQQCNDQLEFPRSLLEVCFDYVVGSAGGMFMHTPLHVPARASGQVLTAWDVDTCLQDRMRHSVRFSLLCCDVVSSYVDAVDDTLACFSLRVSSRGRRAIALAAARTIDARYDPSTAAAYYPFDIQDGEDDDVFQLFYHARCAPDADISLDSTERRLVARADATHASCVCEASSPEHRVESSEKHGSPSLDAEVAMRMFTRTSMFRDFNAIVWRVLIESCNNMVCTLYERFQAEQLFNVSREELDCVATSVKVRSTVAWSSLSHLFSVCLMFDHVLGAGVHTAAIPAALDQAAARDGSLHHPDVVPAHHPLDPVDAAQPPLCRAPDAAGQRARVPRSARTARHTRRRRAPRHRQAHEDPPTVPAPAGAEPLGRRLPRVRGLSQAQVSLRTLDTRLKSLIVYYPFTWTLRQTRLVRATHECATKKLLRSYNTYMRLKKATL